VRVRFPPFTIDSDTRQLSRDDREDRDVHLSPKAFDLLWFLIQNRPKVLDKALLHTRIWPGTFVVDANLSVVIGEIRKALSDDIREPRFIRTVHGVGYAFSGDASDEGEAPTGSRPVPCWLTWKGTTFPLKAGDNVIGRGPHATVSLQGDGVSRRHANIHVDLARRQVTVSDLGSTNGTFLRRTRVTGPVALQDNDIITIGSVDVRLSLWATDEGPKTKRIRRRHRESADPDT